MHCPRDNAALSGFPRQKPAVHTCPQCRGVWLPNKALRHTFANHAQHDGRLANLLEGHFAQVTSPDKLCPTCSQTHLSVCKIAGVEVDFCPQCNGVWLDQGELQHLTSWYKKHQPVGRERNGVKIIEGTIDFATDGPEVVGEIVTAVVELVVEGISAI